MDDTMADWLHRLLHRHDPDDCDRGSIADSLARIARDLDLLASQRLPSGLRIHQHARPQGVHHMPITGITLGATGTFSATPTPSGTAFPAGTTFNWTSDDSLTTLTPSADGTSVSVATSPADPAPSFNLTCTSSFTPPGSTTPVSGTVNVPLLGGGGGGGGNTPTGIQIDQTA